MSAFLCGRDHIDLLVSNCADSWFHDNKRVYLHDTPRIEVGRIMIRENIVSLRHRYPDYDWWATDDAWYDRYLHTPVLEDVSAEQIITACDCLAYQSCEHPGWDSSEAKAIVDATRTTALRVILNRCDDLMWEWHRRDNRKPVEFILS